MTDYAIVRCSRCKPIRTIERLKFLGVKYATISEHTPNKPFEQPESAGYVEIQDNEIQKYAQLGYAIFYKTASLGGRSRVYRSVNPIEI
jgi:hypothetical protein